MEDIEVKGNHWCKHSDMTCVIETQTHLLHCEKLPGQNENVTFIPDYKELYSGNLKDKFYVSRLLKNNFKRRVLDK